MFYFQCVNFQYMQHPNRNINHRLWIWSSEGWSSLEVKFGVFSLKMVFKSMRTFKTTWEETKIEELEEKGKFEESGIFKNRKRHSTKPQESNKG